MQNEKNAVKLSIKDGRYVCPLCKQKTNQAASDATNAQNLHLWCKQCKAVHIVNIVSGQCYVVRRYR